ncbi:Mu transposase domain-containing protein [Kitasatospora aureofaciens]|uniref:Mu transposase domain-containing protein n=1 Tax=Kitasatospora aureofaciens TaxID=1894 RepID=UPI003F4D0DD9
MRQRNGGEQVYYSAPAKFIGAKVRVKLRANELWVFDGRKVVARHPRLTRRYTYHDFLDHCLEILLVKRGAFAGASALAQARAEGGFTRVHEAFWAAAKAKAGAGGHPDADRGAAAAPPAPLGGDEDLPADRVGLHRPGRHQGPQGDAGHRRGPRRRAGEQQPVAQAAGAGKWRRAESGG